MTKPRKIRPLTQRGYERELEWLNRQTRKILKAATKAANTKKGA